MKHILSLALVLFGSQAFARTPIMFQNEVLRKVELNGQAQPGLVALLELDFFEGQMVVRIQDDVCGHFAPPSEDPERRVCLAMPREIATYVVPMKERKRDGCGSTIYSGFRDLRPVDGNRVDITVTDHSLSVCDVAYVSDMIVEVAVQQGWGRGAPAGPRLRKVYRALK